MGEAFEVPFTSRCRGLGILINKRIPFKLVSKHADIYCRFLKIKFEMFGELCTLLNINNTPTSKRFFLSEIQMVLVLQQE